MTTEDKPTRPPLADHLANERTFLAWIRTAVAITGFGFVVVKFSIFLKQVSLAINHPQPIHPTGNSHIIGILLVSLGALVIIFSYLRYQNTASAIEQGTYYNPKLSIKLLAMLLFVISIILLIYLLLST